MWNFIIRQMLRQWPAWASYAAALLLVGAAFAGHRVWPEMQAYPFFFYFPAVFLAAVLFNHGSGFLATALAPAWSRCSSSPGTASGSPYHAINSPG